MRKRLEVDDDMMQRHIKYQGAFNDDEEMELNTNFDTVFKYLFCVTAQELADQLRTPLVDLGVLHDDILVSNTTTDLLNGLISKDAPMHRKGQMLFAVRHLDRDQASRFEASGFRFASTQHIVPPLARTIHVTPTTLDNHIRDMRDYAITQGTFEPGVHLTAFVLRPTARSNSNNNLEVLTAKGVGNPLPSVTFPMETLSVSQMRLLSRMNGWSILTCMNWLSSEKVDAANRSDFGALLLDAMDNLASILPPDLHTATRFTGRPHVAPCRGNMKDCIILSFCVMADPGIRISRPDCTFTPFSIFRTEQQMNGAEDDREMASKDLSIGSLQLDEKKGLARPSQAHYKNNNQPPTEKRVRSSEALEDSSYISTSSQESLVAPPRPVGDITVSKEVRVDVANLEDALAQSMQRHGSLTAVAAGDGAVSSGTYVDELCDLCSAPGIRLRPDSIFDHTR